MSILLNVLRADYDVDCIANLYDLVLHVWIVSWTMYFANLLTYVTLLVSFRCLNVYSFVEYMAFIVLYFIYDRKK